MRGLMNKNAKRSYIKPKIDNIHMPTVLGQVGPSMACVDGAIAGTGFDDQCEAGNGANLSCSTGTNYGVFCFTGGLF